MTKLILVSAASVFFGWTLQSCTNEPAEFSQAQGQTKTISIKVESPSESEAAENGEENGETTNPAIAAGETKLDALLEGFDSAGSEGFNPDGYIDDDIETEANGENTPDAAKSDTDTTSTDTTSTDTTSTDTTSTGTGSDTTGTTDSTPGTTTGSTEPPTPGPTTTTPSNENPDEIANKSEVALCAKLAGVKPEKVILERPSSIKSGSVIALKISGNNDETVLDLAGDANAALRGICIFATGNQAKFSAKIALKVENFLFVGRGNEGKSDVTVEGNGAMTAVVVSLKGNDNSFHFKSNGKPTCADIFDLSKDGSFTCE